MENIALIDSFSEFKDNKSIDRVTLMSILEEVFRATLKRKFGSDDNFDIIINPDKGDLEIWRNRVVVADGFSEDDNEEIELAEARLIEPDFEIGEDVSEEVKLVDLGRRAILALRQNLISKIYEHDSTNILSLLGKTIGRGGVNIRLASELTGYEIDVQREGLEEEDVELTEFRDEIEPWVIQEFKNIGLDTAKSVLDASVEELLKRTDLEEETILDVQRILKEEFEE